MRLPGTRGIPVLYLVPGQVRYGTSENLNTGRSNACLLCWTVPGKPGTVRCTRYWYQYQVVTGMPFRRRSNMSTEEFTRFYNYTRVFPSRQKTRVWCVSVIVPCCSSSTMIRAIGTLSLLLSTTQEFLRTSLSF